jgi:hypothetical protein
VKCSETHQLSLDWLLRYSAQIYPQPPLPTAYGRDKMVIQISQWALSEMFSQQVHIQNSDVVLLEPDNLE